MSDATIIREVVQPLTRSAQDYDSLLALIGDARFVLLGEASHGTQLARVQHEVVGCSPVLVQRDSCQRDVASWSSACNQWSSARPTGLPSCSQIR